jgi:hypothetical protein
MYDVENNGQNKITNAMLFFMSVYFHLCLSCAVYVGTLLIQAQFICVSLTRQIYKVMQHSAFYILLKARFGAFHSFSPIDASSETRRESLGFAVQPLLGAVVNHRRKREKNSRCFCCCCCGSSSLGHQGECYIFRFSCCLVLAL